MTTSFITTAIPFVNARPHLGFAYELVLADILARHRRRRGRDVLFTTGTDDNSLKNVLAAEREGVATSALVDRNSDAFRQLGALLDVAPDDFIATSRDPRHRPRVEAFWRACGDDLYRKKWQGLHCNGCEAFVDACDEHDAPLEAVEEENWFFRLSRYREPVRDAILSGRLRLDGAARAETLAFLDGEVRDLSVSRVATRSRGWGIPVPGDPSQVIYVWFDALVNYLSLLDDRPQYWEGERLHVIGKGITRFHAVYWPAFLLSAGIPLPDRLAVHGYLTVDGKKISKSGAGLEVAPFVELGGADALRWYFARACRTRADSDVSKGRIVETHDRDLADRLGNLVQRCTVLAAKHGVVRSDEPHLRAVAEALPAQVDAALDQFLFDDAAARIVELLDLANRTLDATAPWKLPPEQAARALYAPLEAARIAAGELSPFVPTIARTILARLGPDDPTWGQLAARAGEPPIPRLDRRGKDRLA